MTELYKPPYATTDIAATSNLIVGIQGPPGSGKSASALTFPNPVIALFEKPDLAGLLTLPHLRDVKPQIIPFYDPAFVLDIVKHPRSGEVVDNAGCFKRWLDNGEANKLTRNQTLVLDNWTRLQECFDEVNWSMPLYPTYSKKGEIDDFAPWDRKIEYCEKVANALVSLNCNVVVLFHEVQEREQGTGRLLDKIQPLQQGKFVAKLKSYFSNFYRQHSVAERDSAGKPVEGKMRYVWQIKSTPDFDAKCSKPLIEGIFVEANYKSIMP